MKLYIFNYTQGGYVCGASCAIVATDAEGAIAKYLQWTGNPSYEIEVHEIEAGLIIWPHGYDAESISVQPPTPASGIGRSPDTVGERE